LAASVAVSKAEDATGSEDICDTSSPVGVSILISSMRGAETSFPGVGTGAEAAAVLPHVPGLYHDDASGVELKFLDAAVRMLGDVATRRREDSMSFCSYLKNLVIEGCTLS